MSDNGVVVGVSEVLPSSGIYHPLRFDGQTTVDLTKEYPTLSGLGAINNDGWMLGAATGSTSPMLLYNRALAPLQTLLVDSSLRLESTTLNNAGQLLALVVDQAGARRYFVLSIAN